MYYGLQCYNKEGQPLGWLYTYNNDTELTFTTKHFDWCRRWKTERGAKKNFGHYNRLWNFKSKGGYLKIEVMPEASKIESPKPSHNITQKTQHEDERQPTVWSFQPTPETQAWLEEERQEDKEGNLETNEALLTRKLEKLRKLEQQGF